MRRRQPLPPAGWHWSSATGLIQHSPTPPQHPAQSDDLRIMRAWLEAELAHPGETQVILAAVSTAVSACVARRLGRAGASDVWALIPDQLRPLFGLPEGQGFKLLLGYFTLEGGDERLVPGLAGLTPQECRCYWWELRGWEPWEMQRELTAPGLRFDRARWIAIKTVYNHLAEARTKVRRLFVA